jgi:uncharacterized membrane protein YgcG
MSVLKNNFVVGLTAALAATVIAPVLVPALRRGSRPAAKGVIRGGMLLYRKGRQAVAATGEMMEDVMAEIRAEDMQRHEAAGADKGSGAESSSSGGGASSGGSSSVTSAGDGARTATVRPHDGASALEPESAPP